MPQYPVIEYALSPPPLEELADVLRPALQSNFAHASASVVTCPDLREPPFHLAAAGLSGDERIADAGGQRNLYPIPNLEARYSLLDIAQHIHMSADRGFLIGAGAGPFHVLGVNAELMPNLSWRDGFENVTNLTRYAKIVNPATTHDDDDDNKTSSSPSSPVLCTKSPSTDFGLMANLYASQGLQGPVLRLTAHTRTGPLNFTDCIRHALREHYRNNPISLGGTFLIRSGTANLHVMPDFPGGPFRDRAHVDAWLKYFDLPAPLVCLSVLHSFDPDPERLGLRLEHTHCFGVGGQHAGSRGGHYHYDVNGPDDEGVVEYEAYFNTAKVLYRVDRPAM